MAKQKNSNGSNRNQVAYGVYDDWGEVMRARLYIKEIKTQRFDNY